MKKASALCLIGLLLLILLAGLSSPGQSLSKPAADFTPTGGYPTNQAEEIPRLNQIKTPHPKPEELPPWLRFDQLKVPKLPHSFQPAQLICADEVTWSNGAMQRRSMHQAGPDRILLLETTVIGSGLLLRHYYSADRLLLLEKNGNIAQAVALLSHEGYRITQGSPEDAHAYVHLENAAQFFNQLEQLKEKLLGSAEVRLEPVSAERDPNRQ